METPVPRITIKNNNALRRKVGVEWAKMLADGSWKASPYNIHRYNEYWEYYDGFSFYKELDGVHYRLSDHFGHDNAPIGDWTSVARIKYENLPYVYNKSTFRYDTLRYALLGYWDEKLGGYVIVDVWHESPEHKTKKDTLNSYPIKVKLLQWKLNKREKYRDNCDIGNMTVDFRPYFKHPFNWEFDDLEWLLNVKYPVLTQEPTIYCVKP